MARKKSSVCIAASAAGSPAGRFAKKKMAARKSELRKADFQFQRLTRTEKGSRSRRKKTAPTERSGPGEPGLSTAGGKFALDPCARHSGKPKRAPWHEP